MEMNLVSVTKPSAASRFCHVYNTLLFENNHWPTLRHHAHQCKFAPNPEHTNAGIMTPGVQICMFDGISDICSAKHTEVHEGLRIELSTYAKQRNPPSLHAQDCQSSFTIIQNLPCICQGVNQQTCYVLNECQISCTASQTQNLNNMISRSQHC